MRLIDADALKADYGMKDDCADCDKELRGKSKACEFDRVYTKMDFCGWLDDAPTVDAVPVVHGRWKEAPGVDFFWVCSACGYPSEAFAANVLYKYCPRCGARMEEQNG
ncbi:MAG: hypothetical protein IIZ93_07260 [Acidaminococcaceae bacterium]|nr:hypothetical protein [Acidaminococcaceae bacterium]